VGICRGPLSLLDPVFHPGVEAVSGFQVSDVGLLGVGDQGLVAQAVGIEEGVAGAGRGLHPAHQHLGTLGPGREIEQGRDLGHLGPHSFLSKIPCCTSAPARGVPQLRQGQPKPRLPIRGAKGAAATTITIP